MAKYEITSPSGERFEITAPDDATEDQVLAFAQEQFQQQAPQQQPADLSGTPRQIIDDMMGRTGRPPTDPSTVMGVPTNIRETGELISNIPGSAFRLGKNIVQPFLNPVETARGLGRLGLGIGQKFTPGVQENEQLVDAVGQAISDRFGSSQATKKTIINDPVGFAADISAVFGLSGAGLKAAGFSDAAQTAQAASRAFDPILQTAKATKAVVKPTAARILGGTTGSNDIALREAMKAGEAFKKAMRGKIDDAQVVDMAKDSLNTMKETRSAAYRDRLASVKSANVQIPIDDIKVSADGWLKRFGVAKNTDGTLDFSRSSITGKAVDEVQAIYDDVSSWGSKPGDLTPISLDTLKRRIGDFYATNSSSRAMSANLSDAVAKKIAKVVPEYGEMTKDYGKATEVIKNIERAISLKDSAAADTALRKLLTAIREDKGFRRDMIKQLGDAGGQDILGAAAGRVMSQPFANRLGPMLTGAGATIGVFSNPWMAALLPIASPRLVGEVTVALSRLSQAAGKVPRAAYLAPAEIGQLSGVINGNQVQQ